MMRAYTVAEIDALRLALRERETIKIWTGADYIEGDWEKLVRETAEDQLRTHMLAGHTADDIKEPA